MYITETLIEKFLAGRCTDAEAAAVSRYFRKNPEVWKACLSGNWDEADAESALPFNLQEEMFEEISKQTIARKIPETRVVVRMGLRIAAAVAAVALIYWGVLRLQTKDKKPQDIVRLASPAGHSAAISPAHPLTGDWKLSTNHTDQKLKLKLEDGSVVTLLPRSSIRYARHFTNNSNGKRDVYLQGQAFFDVARDKARPFTVYAGNMSTTVLGTSFSVQENETGVLVKLYSGKVMVHTVKQPLGVRDILLSPGEQLRYDSGENLATVSHFTMDKPAPKLPGRALAEADPGMTFDNTVLPDVLDKLIGHYHMTIMYDKAELSNMYFSGQVLESDSLSVILKVIANMNGLQVSETNDGFTVHPRE